MPALHPSGSLQAAWRKNAPEVRGLFDGSLPSFVTAARVPDRIEGVPVFCYHLVESERLRADLEFLAANGYRTLTADELLAYLEGSAAVPARSVVLTFDDGPRNFHDVAFPILRHFRAHATAFVAPGLHAAAADEDSHAADRPMTWEELQELHASGLIDLQSHTFESRYVPDWPAPAPLEGCAPALEARRRSAAPQPIEVDFARSRDALEARLPGLAVRHLSFPMYRGTAEAVDCARRLGFKACYWGYRERRPLNVAGQSPYFISRMSDEFVRRLPGDGRISALALATERWRRIKAARRRTAAHGHAVHISGRRADR